MSKIKNSEILKSFDKFKKHDDEKFKFLKFPNVNKYEYVISNYGQLFKFVTEKLKKVYEDKDGYYKTSLGIYVDGERLHRNYYIHRMVAYTFCELHNGYNVVNHIDGNKKNNYYKNLEWTTSIENTRHALRTGLQCNSGVNCPSAIYSEETVRLICKMFEDGYDNYDIYKKITGDKKVTDRKIYALIHSIKTKKRHREISNEYNIPSVVISKTKKKFTQEEIDLIKTMIKDGKSSSDIIKVFGGTTTRSEIGKRVSDKIQLIKKEMKNEG